MLPQLAYSVAGGVLISVAAAIVVSQGVQSSTRSAVIRYSGMLGAMAAWSVTSGPEVPFIEEILLTYAVVAAIGLFSGRMVYSLEAKLGNNPDGRDSEGNRADRI
jgi:hypothetical protein